MGHKTLIQNKKNSSDATDNAREKKILEKKYITSSKRLQVCTVCITSVAIMTNFIEKLCHRVPSRKSYLSAFDLVQLVRHALRNACTCSIKQKW